REGQARLGGMAGQLREALGAVRTVQAYGVEQAEAARFSSRAEVHAATLARAAWARAAVPALAEGLGARAGGAGLVWAAGGGAGAGGGGGGGGARGPGPPPPLPRRLPPLAPGGEGAGGGAAAPPRGGGGGGAAGGGPRPPAGGGRRAGGQAPPPPHPRGAFR